MLQSDHPGQRTETRVFGERNQRLQHCEASSLQENYRVTNKDSETLPSKMATIIRTILFARPYTTSHRNGRLRNHPQRYTNQFILRVDGLTL